MEIVPVNTRGTLFVSGAIDDWSLLRDQGVDTIVDLDAGVDPGIPVAPNEILYVYFPILDEGLPNLKKLDALGRFVANLVELDHAVLVHCRLGLNRSVLVAATALTYLGMTGREALQHVREVRPGALFNETFASHIEALPARRFRLETLRG